MTILTPAIVRELSDALGPRLLAFTLDASAADIESWARREDRPSPEYERRLREAYEAWRIVCTVEAPETTRAWWMGMKHVLGDLSPAEAIALDRGSDVIAVARAYVQAS